MKMQSNKSSPVIIYLANPTMCSLRKRAGTGERREGTLATHPQCDLGCVPDFSGLRVLFFIMAIVCFCFCFVLFCFWLCWVFVAVQAFL